MLTRSPAAAVPAYLVRTSSPLGRIEVTASVTAITSLAIERAEVLPHDDLDEHPNELLERAVEQLSQYFSSGRRTFELPVSLPGTEFQKAIWTQLSQLPFGEVASYGQLGIASGRPTAGRAVGGAVGANPVPILVPCHRVLASNRRITGYSGGNGIPTKVWLLEHEGIEHRV